MPSTGRHAEVEQHTSYRNIVVIADSSMDKKFPIERCRWLPQTELTLNLLRSATHAPDVSAYAYLFGEFKYNVHPLAPLGTAV